MLCFIEIKRIKVVVNVGIVENTIRLNINKKGSVFTEPFRVNINFKWEFIASLLLARTMLSRKQKRQYYGGYAKVNSVLKKKKHYYWD